MAEARARRFDFWSLMGGKELLEKEGFRRLLITRVLGQIGQNALFYTLFVLIAQARDASIYTGILVVVYAIPAVTLGPLSGVVVDRVSRGWLLVVVNAMRAIICLGIMASGQGVWALYGFSLLLSASGQFVGPAESAALAQLVEREELTTGSSLFNLVALGGQAIGMAAIGPAFLKTVGADPLFILSAVLFAIAAIVITAVGRLTVPPQKAFRAFADERAGVRTQFARAWRSLREDRKSYMAVIMNVVASASLLIGVTVLPRYGRDVLGVSAENLIFVFSPGAIGVFLGLRFASWVEGVIGKATTVTVGFALMVGSMLAFGLVGRLGGLIADQNIAGLFDPGPFDERSGRIIVTMATAVVTGIGYSLIGVASRALINERVAVEMQGRIFAALAVLTSLASIVPLLVAGALADVLGVQQVLVASSVIMILVVLWMAWRTRFTIAAPGEVHG